MKLNGVDVRFEAAEAHAICLAITGQTWQAAGGGVPFVTTSMGWSGTTWTLVEGLDVAPLQRLECRKQVVEP